MNDGGPESIVRLVDTPSLDDELLLPERCGRALAAWQARPGEVLTIVDPLGICYRARLTVVDPPDFRCIPFAALAAPAESPLTIEVYQALPEKERFELILQKLTEVGVSRIVPMQTQRSTTVAERDAGQRKSHRWPAVIRAAARQCRRAMLPGLGSPLSFDEALSHAAAAELTLLMSEQEDAWSLDDAVGKLRPQSVALLIGPEGGFAPEEIVSARNSGVLPVHLGPRILRTETAAIVAAALVQGRLGDLR